MKNAENLEKPNAVEAEEDKYDIKRTELETADGDFVLEECINKESGELEVRRVMDKYNGEIFRFTDIKALENSEYIFDLAYIYL